MRIGIDARVIYHPQRDYKTRVGHYIYSLIKGLKEKGKGNEYVLFFDSRIDHKTAKKFEDKNIKVVYFPFSAYRKFLHVSYSQLIVSAIIAKERLDIFHGASGTIPLTCFTPCILSLFQIEEGRVSRFVQNSILKKAEKIIVFSPSIKRKLIKTYKLSAEKIEVMEEYEKISDAKTGDEKVLAEKTLEVYKKVVVPKKKSTKSFFRKIIPSRKKAKK